MTYNPKGFRNEYRRPDGTKQVGQFWHSVEFAQKEAERKTKMGWVHVATRPARYQIGKRKIPLDIIPEVNEYVTQKEAGEPK